MDGSSGFLFETGIGRFLEKMEKKVSEIIRRNERELLDSIVPFWERFSPDRAGGGFFNLLDRDGSVIDPGKFSRMQWRTSYMFARLYNSEYRGGERWLELARRGFEFCIGKMRREDGFYEPFLGAGIFPGGRRPMPGGGGMPGVLTMSYAVAACAELYHASGEEQHRTEALSAFNLLRQGIETLENPPEPSAFSRRRMLGVHMHFLLACTAVLNRIGDADGTIRAQIEAEFNAVTMFRNPEMKFWFEYRGSDGAFDLDNSFGRTITVGHGFETLSFLTQALRVVGGHEELLARIPGWIAEVFEYGWDRRRGGVFLCIDALGRSRLEPSGCLKPWWPQTEAMLALVNGYVLSRDSWFLDRYEEVSAWAFAHFRDPEYPEWFSEVSLEGAPAGLAKGLPYKTFYHLPRALFYTAQLLKRDA